MKSLVDDDLVREASLFKRRFLFFRLDVIPFFIYYVLALWLAISDNYKVYGLILAPIGFVAHMILFLFTRWSVKLNCLVANTPCTSIDTADLVCVTAAPNAGSSKILPIYKVRYELTNKPINVVGIEFRPSRFLFQFQQVNYYHDCQQKDFRRLQYPTNTTVQSFLSWRGYQDLESVAIATLIWGYNAFDIPMPSFLDLYIEHLIAPFFVFQVLCLFLWSLDDYWYYSAFTLLMLMFFEGMMCKQRLSSVSMLRQMRRPAIPVFAFRVGEWMVVSSDELVPGDLISVASCSKSRKGNDESIIPCDAMLVRGSCVINEAMLTGETVPQVKETIKGADDINGIVNCENEGYLKWRRYMLFSGTSILQHTELSEIELRKSVHEGIPSSPNRGCIAVVIRTSFGTSQGGLMRKILYATERVTGNSQETFYFIGILVLFAIFASVVVLYYGLRDETRNKFKLVLHCVMIVTSVVPPELPMELSLSVTNSLMALSRGLVYCTEPFRIPFAGKLDVLCFDKTGTLTKDKMILKGICAAQNLDLAKDLRIAEVFDGKGESITEMIEPTSAPTIVLTLMGCCHDLVFTDENNLEGDPLELATYGASGFLHRKNRDQNLSLTLVNAAERTTATILRHYPFSSTLKRMSCLTVVESDSLAETMSFIFTKGAPESLRDLLAVVPPFYDSTFQYHMMRGKRVLAMATKRMHGLQNPLEQTRDIVEKDLHFLGFMVFECEFKADTKSVIRELRSSEHRIVMLTGDSVYTAADVGRKLGIVAGDNKTILILQLVKSKLDTELDMVWRKLGNYIPTDNEQLDDIGFDLSQIRTLAVENDLCVTGAALSILEKKASNYFGSVLRTIAPSIKIFARVSPSQKELIINALNDLGCVTLMCGDGTNDVGALKAAHVGVSIVNNPEFEQRIEAGESSDHLKKGTKKSKAASSRDRMARAMRELQEQEADPTIVKLGDASIASPFTARRTSIDSVLTVIRQGRCTLVTSIQVYKVLALNCLVSAYMMSALYLIGLKQGDIQMTASGLVTAGLFFFLSQAQPLTKISTEKPPSTIFDRSVMVSIVGQFIVHFFCLLGMLSLCSKYISMEKYSQAPDGKFQPNLINSSFFLLSSMMQVNNFVVNYRGEPFTKSIFENTMLWRSVQILYLLVLILAGGQVEPLNDLLQMASFPSSEFQAYLVGILMCNLVGTYFIERLSQQLK